jgi:hypothetical protein
MAQRTWVNPQQPDQGVGPEPTCPRCGSPIARPFAAYDQNNQAIQKTACSNIGCPYVVKIIYGFGTVKDADTISFK